MSISVTTLTSVLSVQSESGTSKYEFRWYELYNHVFIDATRGMDNITISPQYAVHRYVRSDSKGRLVKRWVIPDFVLFKLTHKNKADGTQEIIRKPILVSEGKGRCEARKIYDDYDDDDSDEDDADDAYSRADSDDSEGSAKADGLSTKTGEYEDRKYEDSSIRKHCLLQSWNQASQCLRMSGAGDYIHALVWVEGIWSLHKLIPRESRYSSSNTTPSYPLQESNVLPKGFNKPIAEGKLHDDGGAQKLVSVVAKVLRKHIPNA